MLCVGNSDRERQVLPAGKRNDKRRLLSQARSTPQIGPSARSGPRSSPPAPPATPRWPMAPAATIDMSAPTDANASSVRDRARPARPTTGKALASRSGGVAGPAPPPAIKAPACPPGETRTRRGGQVRSRTRRRPVRPARRERRGRQVRAERAAGLSARRDANPRRQVPAGRAAGMSARRDANPKRKVRARLRRPLVRLVSLRNLRGGVRAGAAVRDVRRANSGIALASALPTGGFPGSFPQGGPGEFAPRAPFVPGQGGETPRP